MKRLVLFCDGTWNDTRMSSLTNVARLARCVEPVDERSGVPIQQVVFYDTGVGVASSVSKLTDFLVRLQGGAFGRGLDEKIEAAYRFLVLNYEVGDEIYVFGFSRGAYTARSLCGLVRKCGILRRSCFDRIPQAIALYRDRETPPHKVSEFRRAHAHHAEGSSDPVASGPEDLAEDERGLWEARYPEPSRLQPLRAVRGKPDEDVPFDDWQLRLGIVDGRARATESAGEAQQRVYRLMYLGVWDTVGALGVPTRFPILSGLLNKRYRFHDTDASSLMTSIRHAVAVNEDRQVFDVSPVSNIESLNHQWATALGLPWPLPYRALPYQQRWFPGDHGAVGGGNPEPGLSSAALLWIAEGAQIEGLCLNDAPLNDLSEAARLRNPLAEWRIDKDGKRKAAWTFDFLGFIGGYRDRTGPLTEPEVHETTQTRWRAATDYRPAPLQRFTGKTSRAPAYRWVARVLYPVFIVTLAVTVALASLLLAATLAHGAPEALPTVCRWLSAAGCWLTGLFC